MAISHNLASGGWLLEYMSVSSLRTTRVAHMSRQMLVESRPIYETCHVQDAYDRQLLSWSLSRLIDYGLSHSDQTIGNINVGLSVQIYRLRSFAAGQFNSSLEL